MGKVVLVEELCATHLPFEKGIKIQNSRATVCSVNRGAGLAESMNAHIWLYDGSVKKRWDLLLACSTTDVRLFEAWTFRMR